MKQENTCWLIIYEAALFDMNETEIIGKRDDDFVPDKKEMEIIKNSDQEVLRFKKAIELPDQNLGVVNR